MTHLQNDSPDPSNNSVLYYFFWVVTFLASNAAGVTHRIAQAFPEITIPSHDIWYLPQLHLFIPALILAGACCIISFIGNKLLNFLWNKMFSKKP